MGTASEGPELMQYYRLATQYYVAGRYAALVWLIPVAGNLLHHAIEMYLKGCLASSQGAAALKQLGHHLPAIWARFKTTFPVDGLDSFDHVVAALDRFEAIRYPEHSMAGGMFSTISLVGPPPAMEPRGPDGPMPEYHLVISEVDAIVGVIFKQAHVSVNFFTSTLRPEAREYLFRNNKHIFRTQRNPLHQ